MAKTWVLDTGTKGTGANVVPLEKVEKDAEAAPERGAKPRPRAASRPRERSRPRRRTPSSSKTSSPLPPGHVRKKATGEIGKVRAVDAKAGTATVYWLKRGATSTVPLSAVSRR
jgi:hypothetical protein